MLIRATIITQIIVLVTSATFQLSSQLSSHSDTAADQQVPDTVTASNPNPVLDPTGIYGADETMKQQILDAIDRYDTLPQALPALRIYVHDTDEPCNGNNNQGLYNKGGDQYRIDLCSTSIKVLTHELAHAWEYHNINDATRAAYVELAGLRVWNDKDVAHPARGVEQVAWLITWGLDDQPIQAMLLGHYAEDLDRFELLTGTPSPRIAHLDTTTDGSTPTPARLTVDVSDIVVEPVFQ
jgi:hypothetical protein